MKSIIAISVLLVLASTISIPVTSQQDKCMIVYSTSAEDYLKIDMKFEKFTGQTDQQYYLVYLNNTETGVIESFNVSEGLFRRQIELTESVIYKLCVRIVLNRYGSSQIQKYVQYNSGIKHSVDSNSKIEIPQNLLKIKDLQQTYRELVSFTEKNEYVKKEAVKIQQQQDELFKQQQEKIKKIQWITIIEFAAITAFGIYQYFRLRDIIENKQR